MFCARFDNGATIFETFAPGSTPTENRCSAIAPRAEHVIRCLCMCLQEIAALHRSRNLTGPSKILRIVFRTSFFWCSPRLFGKSSVALTTTVELISHLLVSTAEWQQSFVCQPCPPFLRCLSAAEGTKEAFISTSSNIQCTKIFIGVTALMSMDNAKRVT